MQEVLTTFMDSVIEYLKVFGPLGGSILIILESILPVLPLAVFISFNFAILGFVLGFIVSWVSTIIGCLIAYQICYYLVNKYFSKSNKKLDNMVKRIRNISFSKLVLIIAFPFTPAFLVNIAAGICEIGKKKFLMALLIGKISIVFFWGYIGTSFIESIQNPRILIRIGLILLVVYLISVVVNKKLKVEE